MLQIIVQIGATFQSVVNFRSHGLLVNLIVSLRYREISARARRVLDSSRDLMGIVHSSSIDNF